jgi:hypothetical protein
MSFAALMSQFVMRSWLTIVLSQLTTSQRSEIVKAAAKVLDVKDAQLLAKVGCLILKITVSS